MHFPYKTDKVNKLLDNFAALAQYLYVEGASLDNEGVMKEIVKKTMKYVLSAAVAVVLMWFSFREVKWEDFVRGLRDCRWECVALSMAAGVMAFWFRAVRWRQLILPIDPTTTRTTTFNAVNIGYIANFVFPRIGEFVRCGVVTKNSASAEAQAHGAKKASYDKVLGTVVLERGWDMLTMLLLLVVLLAARWEKFGGFFIGEIWLPASQRLNFSIWWIVALLGVVIIAAIIAIWRFRSTNTLCSKAWGIFTGLWQGFASCLKMDRKWLFLVYTAAIWAMYWLMAAATMWAVPSLSGLTIIDALFLSLVGSLGWIVPVPGGFGAFHFIVSLALSTIYGIPFEMGIIFATLSHESQAVTMALFGGGSYIYETFRK